MDCGRILPNLFVGVCPRTVDDIDELKREHSIDGVLNLQTDEDFWRLGIDWSSIEEHCETLGIKTRRAPVRDFDGDDLCKQLAKCVRTLE